MSSELIKILEKRIKLKECTHLKARPGLGATTILKRLTGVYVQPRPLKPIMLALAHETKGSINELKKVINPEQILLVDDIHEITKQIKNYLGKLLNHGLVMVTAGQRNVFKFFELELKDLSYHESVKLVRKHLKNLELARVIVSEVGGNPSLLMNAVRKAKARSDLKTLKGFEEFKQSINASLERKDLFKPALISVIAGVLISLRYLFYRLKDFESGYTVAMIAYSLITLSRIGKLNKS